jgi:hypothetical protein
LICRPFISRIPPDFRKVVHCLAGEKVLSHRKVGLI